MAQRSTACGTPLYMTPEGVKNFKSLHNAQGGVKVGKEADWYALGTLLYELTIGEAPFQADEQHVLLNKIMSEPLKISSSVRIQPTTGCLKEICSASLARGHRSALMQRERESRSLASGRLSGLWSLWHLASGL